MKVMSGTTGALMLISSGMKFTSLYTVGKKKLPRLQSCRTADVAALFLKYIYAIDSSEIASLKSIADREKFKYEGIMCLDISNKTSCYLIFLM